MKVFDFTNGVKGKLLSEVHRPSYATGCLRDDKFYSNKNKSITFMFGAGSTFKGVDTPLNPKDFGRYHDLKFCPRFFLQGGPHPQQYRLAKLSLHRAQRR